MSPRHDAIVRRAGHDAGGGVFAAAVFMAVAAYLILRAPEPFLFLESDDQGYQMALGMAVAGGRLPGFDFVTQYGPFVAYASYVGFALTGSVIGEVLLSSAGYAAAVTLACAMVRQQTNTAVSLAVGIALLLLFPRYYKWYYWLLPLLGLPPARAYLIALARGGRRKTLILLGWGQVVGVATLFRYDLGLAGLVFGVVAIAVAQREAGRALRTPAGLPLRDAAWFTSAALAAPVLYVGLIVAARGTDQAWMFLRSMYDGAADSVVSYGIAPWRFVARPALSSTNALGFLQLAFPVVYLFGLCLAVRGQGDGRRGDAFVVFCTTLIGCAVFPQALHRADLQHLLQVEPPFFMLLAMLLYRAAVRPDRIGQGWRALSMAAGGATLVAIALVAPDAAIDLGPAWRNPAASWNDLAGLPGTRPDNPVADMAMKIRELTPARSSVFLAMQQTKMPLLFFAQRHQPGLLPTYEPGMFGNPFWSARNRDALVNHPPDYLVVPQPASPDAVPASAPFLHDLITDWISVYAVRLYCNSRFCLLARQPNRARATE